MTKYIKRLLQGVAVRLSYTQDAWCLKINRIRHNTHFNEGGMTMWNGRGTDGLKKDRQEQSLYKEIFKALNYVEEVFKWEYIQK